MADEGPYQDLGDDTPVVRPSARVAQTAQFSEKPYDPTRERENIRGKIAMRLIWTLVALLAGAFVLAAISIVQCSKENACSAGAASLEPVKAIVQLLLTPLVGLVGAVTGFYFGDQSRNGKP